MYEYNATVVRWVDGDTVDLSVNLGFDIAFKQRFRLLNIDTPETHGVKKESEEYKAGMESFRRVLELAPVDSIVRICTEKDHTDKYGRYLATIWAKDQDGSEFNVNDRLLAEGLAEVWSK